MCKRRVESCLIIGTPRGALRDVEGVWTWSHYGWAVNYAINTTYCELRLSFNHGLQVEQEIPLCDTQPNFGGTRWWFLCPKCNRRVSRLYRPSHEFCFFCRHCHDLTYESAQMSGRESESFFKRQACILHSSTRVAKQWVRINFADQSFVPEVKRPVWNKTRTHRRGISRMVAKQAQSKGLTL